MMTHNLGYLQKFSIKTNMPKTYLVNHYHDGKLIFFTEGSIQGNLRVGPHQDVNLKFPMTTNHLRGTAADCCETCSSCVCFPRKQFFSEGRKQEKKLLIVKVGSSKTFSNDPKKTKRLQIYFACSANHFEDLFCLPRLFFYSETFIGYENTSVLGPILLNNTDP